MSDVDGAILQTGHESERRFSTVTVLRLMIVLEALTMVLTLVVDIASEGMLSPQLRAAKEAEDAQVHTLFLPLGLLLLALTLIAWVGLWRLWRPARSIYLAVAVLTMLLTPFAGAYVATGLSEVVNTLSLGLQGAILALLYFSDVADRFGHSAAV